MKNLFMLVFIIILAYCAHAQMEHRQHEGMSPAEKPGQVKISQERQQLVGIKIGYAQVLPLKKMIRTVGAVAYDPELYSAQTEYAQAVLARDKAYENEDLKIIENAEELLSAAQLNLKRLGLSEAMIRDTKKGDDSLLVGAENGLVWVYGKIYENEIPLVKKGMTAHISSKGLPGKMFMGKIAAVDTVIDEATRSLKIRTAVKNEKGLLKPNMYVDVQIEAPLGKKLAVPEEAVLDAGEHQIVYAVRDGGIFEPKSVIVGQRAEGYLEILKGLKAGEKIVTSGNFLIDSESKLKSTGGEHVH
ncbi:MAG: efflux RND transporter periplasmic adaptor subunit [Candidatus Margulisbacteria bacterium]|nr:efflux RND transporter periplasmic adaptor subunit [Candidatus Margulisiibacteriota bacterium]